MSKYFKNLILCGDIDYHCLLCKESFCTVDDLEKHIRWEKHRKILKGLSCVPKFKKDSIYKVEDKYYCEHCNLVISTIVDISKHLEEAAHKEKKAKPAIELGASICKRELGLIVIDKMKITNKEWNGVIDSNCIFCDVHVDNFVNHISISNHMIQMIQSKILTEDGQYYRKINEEKCYCFSCKKTFLAQSVTDHWTDQFHLEKTNLNRTKETKADRDKKLDVAIQLINSQKDYFDIDLDNKVAMCKICTAYVSINFKFMVDHKKTHNITDKDKIEQATVDMDAVMESLKSKNLEDDEIDPSFYFDHGKRRAELAQFGKEHFIKLIFPGGKGYCSLCSTYISAHMNNFTEHIRGQIHMGHLELKGIDKGVKPHAKPSYKTKRLKDYIKGITYAKELEVLWINKEFCMDIPCFLLLSVIDENNHSKRAKCYACDIIYNHDIEKQHFTTDKHMDSVLNTEVITTLKDEFIREIRPNLYHCGVCNLTFPFWETLEKHLLSWKHVFTKEEKRRMNKFTEQWFGGLACPNLNRERVCAYLISLGIL